MRSRSQSKQFSEAFGLCAADGKLTVFAVIHAQLVGALEPRQHFFDSIDVDYVRAVCAPEEIGIEGFQKLFQGAAVGVSFHRRGRDRNHTLIYRREADIFLVDKDETSGRAQKNLLLLWLLLLFQQVDKRFQTFTRRGRCGEFLPRFFHRLRNAFFVERLEEVVNGIHFEGTDRILIECSRKHDLRKWMFFVDKLFDHLKAIEAGHLHVEKYQLGIMLADELYRLHSVATLSDYVDVADAL